VCGTNVAYSKCGMPFDQLQFLIRELQIIPYYGLVGVLLQQATKDYYPPN